MVRPPPPRPLPLQSRVTHPKELSRGRGKVFQEGGERQGRPPPSWDVLPPLRTKSSDPKGTILCGEAHRAASRGGEGGEADNLPKGEPSLRSHPKNPIMTAPSAMKLAPRMRIGPPCSFSTSTP